MPRDHDCCVEANRLLYHANQPGVCRDNQIRRAFVRSSVNAHRWKLGGLSTIKHRSI